MKLLILTLFIVGFSATVNAQQKKADTTKTKFAPPVIVKDDDSVSKSEKIVRYPPPVVVKDKASKGKKQKKERIKFTPPVIVKDSGENK